MADLLHTGLTSLRAAQLALATAGHNIANVNTDGYSRQRAELGTNLPQYVGEGFIGTGVNVVTVSRSFDKFLTQQVRTHTSTQSQLDVQQGLTGQVDSLLADGQASLAPLLQGVFDAMQAVAEAPAATAPRQTLLSQAQALTDRFHEVDSQLRTMRDNLNQGLRDSVDQINSYARSLAKVNKDIVLAAGTSAASAPPNDLYDERDRLLQKLSEQVGVQAVLGADGTANVYVGTGQPLVTKFDVQALEVGTDPFAPEDVAIRYAGQKEGTDLSSFLTGGKLGGYIAFRTGTLDRVQGDLGLFAAGIASAVNAQQNKGLDLHGELGADFFTTSGPRVLRSENNDGSAQPTVTLTDVSALQRSDYELRYSGGTYSLLRLSDRAVIASGSGPKLSGDGLDIDIATTPPAGPPAEGDRFLIQPTRLAAAAFGVALLGTDQIAAAAPIATAAARANIGTGAISPGVVTTLPSVPPAAPADVLKPVEIRFTSETSFDVVDVSDPLAPVTLQSGAVYDPVAGTAVGVNGWQVRLSGQPQNGDVFTIGPNTAGSGDNRNMLAMTGLTTQRVLVGNTADLKSFYAAVIGDVGAQANRIDTAVTAQTALLDQAKQARESASGVNLDEEAADLVRYQQAYAASAQVMKAADDLFQTLLGIVRR